MAELFRYNSSRAAEARLSKRLSPAWIRTGIVAGGFALGLLGIFYLFVGLNIGWLLLSLASLGFVILFWRHFGLNQIEPIAGGERIDELLEPAALSLLGNSITPKKLSAALVRVAGGQFFAARFGVGSSFLEQLTSDNEQDSEIVWQTALKLRQSLGSKDVSAGILTAALIRSITNVETYLAQLQLDGEDIIAGASWLEHIQSLIKKDQQPQKKVSLYPSHYDDNSG